MTKMEKEDIAFQSGEGRLCIFQGYSPYVVIRLEPTDPDNPEIILRWDQAELIAEDLKRFADKARTECPEG